MMFEGKLDKVIAGLECCGTIDVCLNCPYFNIGGSCDLDCINELAKDALELIRILKAERDLAVGLAEAYGEYVEATLLPGNGESSPECGAHMDEEVVRE